MTTQDGDRSGFSDRPAAADNGQMGFEVPEGAWERFEEKERAIRRRLLKKSRSSDRGLKDDGTSPTEQPNEDGQPEPAERPGKGIWSWLTARRRKTSATQNTYHQARARLQLSDQGAAAAQTSDAESSTNLADLRAATDQSRASASRAGSHQLDALSEDLWASYFEEKPMEERLKQADTPSGQDGGGEFLDVIRAWLDSGGTRVASYHRTTWEPGTTSGWAASMREAGFDAFYNEHQLIFSLPPLVAFVRLKEPKLNRTDVTRMLRSLGYERSRTRDFRFWIGPMVPPIDSPDINAEHTAA
jgi:hypothetical protein